ncbi:MAG: ATP-binding protein [Rudaea sp.]|nr:ATP-binding protein [Rudaea sp.]
MLAWLRVCAVIGQALTVIVVARVLAFPIPQLRLFAGIGVLALFAALVLLRLRRQWPVREAEVVAHLAVDIAVLCYLLYFTGGATNPFISLYIMPIAFAAMALSAPCLVAVVLLAGSAYAVLMFGYVPLPAIHAHDAQFSLHVLGMGINFAISALLLGFFIQRLAAELRARETSAQGLRERALRDAGILAIATQAAGAAHELNTPLSTIRTLLTDLRREHVNDVRLDDDLALLANQADRCRDILRELVDVGTAPLNDATQTLTLAGFATDCADRFRLLRPDIDLAMTLDDDRCAISLLLAPDLRHAVIALLNNAADASSTNKGSPVEFSARLDGDAVEFAVRDRGSGLAPDARAAAGLRFFSDKRDGLGLGLVLANTTAERLNGTLSVVSRAGSGTLTRLRVPLDSIENRRHAS